MIGKTISHYEITEKLGEGGMGVVYKAEDTKLKRTVALKFVPPEALGDPELRTRFLHEAQAAAALSHPNVCTVFDVDEEAGFLVMEYLEGETVQAQIRRRPLPLPEALDIAIQAAQGLQAAHEHGVVHRDVKGANLMVTPHGTVKIMDFGLARLMGLARLTKTGVVAGTTGYMSPEQARGKAVDRRSDLWSLGVVLYEMVTGQLPFRGETDTAVVHSILHADPEPVTALRAGLPVELDRVIGKALEKDPEMRYQSAADMGTDLRRLKRDSDPRAKSTVTPVAVRARPRRRLTRWAAGATVAVVAAAVGIFLWQRMQAKPLTDKDVLVLADFTNTTGDPVFDGTLREALAMHLEQSPFLKILGDEQMRQDLRLMGRPAGERITNQIAREICQREGEKAMVGGSIASLGKTYAITLQATNCQTGEALAREQMEAEDKEHVLRAVATAASRMRAKLGESLASVQRLDVPNQQVTTTSLEAFQAYARGRAQNASGLYLTSIPLFQRATELDPNFASAYLWLGLVYSQVGAAGRGVEYQKKAFALIDRVSERERLTILAYYHRAATGELVKSIDAIQLWARTYPREALPHNVLGLTYLDTGNGEKAVSECQEGLRLDSRYSALYANQANAYSLLGRFDEAKAVAETGLAQKLDSPDLHRVLLRIAYIQEDGAEAERHIEWLAGRPEEYLSVAVQAANAAALGQLRKSQQLLQRGADVTRRRSLPERATQFQAQEALHEALVGNCEAGRSKTPAAILAELAPADTLIAALPLALCGDTVAVQKVADDTSKRYPVHTLWNAVFLPSIRAAVELSRNQPDKSVELLQSATPYERAHASAVYLRGLAYLRARKRAEAAVEFHKILDHKGANWGPFYPLSYVGLARAQALAGNTAEARKAYEDFLALWKDADPGIPILKEAKQEYAKLK